MFFDSLFAVVVELLLLMSFTPNGVDEKLCCAACWIGKGDGEDESELDGDDNDPEPEEIDLVKDPGCNESPIPPVPPFEGEVDKT